MLCVSRAALDLPPGQPRAGPRARPEHQRGLDNRLAGLHPDTFQAFDGIGWAYQFRRAKRKGEVNRPQVETGADELPAVTQRFTEPYMVALLLDNGAITPQELTRHREQQRAAQGRLLRHAGQEPKFEDWDRGANGALTPQELAQGQQERFARRRPGWAPGTGPAWGPDPYSGRPCWRNP